MKSTQTILTVALFSVLNCASANVGVYKGRTDPIMGTRYTVLASISESGRIMMVTQFPGFASLNMNPFTSRVKNNDRFRGNNRRNGVSRSTSVGRVKNGKKMVGTVSGGGSTARINLRKRFD